MSTFLKKIFLIIPLFVLATGIQSCGGTQNSNNLMLEDNTPFNIKDAYFQKWVAGIENGGAGINVHVIFTNLSSAVEVQDVYFRNQIMKMEKSLDNPNEYFADLSNNSRFDVVMDKNPMKEVQNTPNREYPFALKENEAVLSYLFEGKTLFYKISNLREKESMAYPQSNPSRK